MPELKEHDTRPILAVTMGDPAGVGPEIILKALNAKEVEDCCRLVIVGNLKVLEDAKPHLAMSTWKVLTPVSEPGKGAPPGAVQVVDIDTGLPIINPGKASAENGYASVEYIKKAVKLAMDKKVDAIVTAPITKETLRMAGYPYPGHTELLAELTGAKQYSMMLTGGGLNVVLVTIHVALKDVPGLVTKDGVLRAIRMAEGACRTMGIKKPKIAVCGLNPHAGEAGLFGDEENRVIAPACREAEALGIRVFGPLPADTLFHKAHNGEFDAVVAMYHDQGLGPLKMLAFGHAVNVTLGLPIIRTSVDHGTAYDIAGKGIASPDSLIEAIKLAARMARKR